LNGVTIPQSVIEFVPESVARENVILPLAVDHATLTLTTRDPKDKGLIEKCEFIFNRRIKPLPAPADQLVAAINRHYGGSGVEFVDTSISELVDVALEPVDLVVRLVNLILLDADRVRATSVRLRPRIGHIQVDFLIKGKWSQRDSPPRRLLSPIVSRLCALASIADHPEQGQQRTGNLRLNLADNRVDATLTIQGTGRGPTVRIDLTPAPASPLSGGSAETSG
jgi:type IV pilus assembly protein PilB